MQKEDHFSCSFFPHFLKKENSFAASKQHLLLPPTDGTKRKKKEKNNKTRDLRSRRSHWIDAGEREFTSVCFMASTSGGFVVVADVVVVAKKNISKHCWTLSRE